jgi:putative hemolysin
MSLASTSGSYPRFSECLPDTDVTEGRFRLRFARDLDALDAILELRFEVFNLELHEGLESSFATGRDEDEFDAVCHHLMVTDVATDKIVGTYRMQTFEMAGSLQGFYSFSEFDLASVPGRVLAQSVELGRACVAKKYRSKQVLNLLWRGLARYLKHNCKRYLFGCCSLTSQSPAEGKRLMDYLALHQHVHPHVRILPHAEYLCYPEDFVAPQENPVALPRLMQIYLMIGAKICGPPALDRRFKTIDYLALFDVQHLDPRSVKFFFGEE